MKKYTVFFAMTAFLTSIFVANAFANYDENRASPNKKESQGYSLLSSKMEEKLGLTDEQKATWQDTRNKVKALYQEFHQNFKAERAQLKAAVSQQMQADTLDLKAVYDKRQQMQAAFTQLRSEIQALELNLYDQLTDEQKQMVFQKMQQHMEKKPRAHNKENTSNYKETHSRYGDTHSIDH